MYPSFMEMNLRTCCHKSIYNGAKSIQVGLRYPLIQDGWISESVGSKQVDLGPPQAIQS